MGNAIDWLDSQSPENLESEIQKLEVRFAEDRELSQLEIAILKEMLQIFRNYHNPDENLYMLKGMLRYLKNPEAEVNVSISQIEVNNSLFNFEQTMSLKDLIKLSLSLVRNKKIKFSDLKLPRYKTIINSDIKEEKNEFSVDAADISRIRINLAKREKAKYSNKQKSPGFIDRGRIVGLSNKKRGRVAVMPTILNSLNSGHYDIKKRQISILPQHFLYPRYEENVIYNIMLVLDSSSSISWVIPQIEKFIPSITSNAYQSRDKLGLISFQDGYAKIHHYPNLNIKQVAGSINKIITKGHTPLGEGLNLALRVFCRQNYKMPGEKNLIIMISDCYPEPLEGGHKNLLDEPCYKLVLSAVEKIKEERIGFMIINPISDKKDRKGWNDKLIDEIRKIISLKYLEIYQYKKTLLKESDNSFIDTKKVNEFYEMLTEVKMDL
ncbi:MAG: VWA domain-containing protein [Candidatus Cloacimonetes bacterium]|nr:VWA domain-containing protein [Candidatus Cloacimonadota bacterium]